MKKILGAALALSLIGSAAFADVTVRGRGYAETNVFHFKSTSTNDEDNTKTSGTSMFSDWDTGDTDIWVDGVFADGKAGGSLNITFDNADIAFGDWNIWIKPVDFFELRASNEANRWVNRYNSIIDKLESKYGVFTVGGYDSGADWKGNFNSTDSDKLNGFMFNFDFDIVQFQLAANGSLPGQNNWWFSGENGEGINLDADKKPVYDKDAKEVHAGARVAVPIEGIANFYGWYKVDYLDNKSVGESDPNGMDHNFGIYADIVAVENLGIAIGYNGYLDGTREPDGNDYKNVTGVFYNGIDLRVQYMMGNLGLALHNNFTFGSGKGAAASFNNEIATVTADVTVGGSTMENMLVGMILAGMDDGSWIYDKLNLGLSYKVNDTFTAYLELGNQIAVKNGSFSAEGVDMTGSIIKDSIQVYPRVQLNITEGVAIKTGLAMTFDVVHSWSGEAKGIMGNETITADGKLDTTMHVALPLALSVEF